MNKTTIARDARSRQKWEPSRIYTSSVPQCCICIRRFLHSVPAGTLCPLPISICETDITTRQAVCLVLGDWPQETASLSSDAHSRQQGSPPGIEGRGLKLSARSMIRMRMERLFLQEHFYQLPMISSPSTMANQRWRIKSGCVSYNKSPTPPKPASGPGGNPSDQQVMKVFLQEHWTRFAHNSSSCTEMSIAFEMRTGLCCRVALLLPTIQWDALSLLPIRRAAWVRLRPPSI